MTRALILVAAGAVLVVVGVALIHWPSSLIVAGMMLGAAGLFLDLDEG